MAIHALRCHNLSKRHDNVKGLFTRSQLNVVFHWSVNKQHPGQVSIKKSFIAKRISASIALPAIVCPRTYIKRIKPLPISIEDSENIGLLYLIKIHTNTIVNVLKSGRHSEPYFPFGSVFDNKQVAHYSIIKSLLSLVHPPSNKEEVHQRRARFGDQGQKTVVSIFYTFWIQG